MGGQGIYASSVRRRDWRRSRVRRRVGLLIPIAVLAGYAAMATTVGVVAVTVARLIGV